MKDVVFDDEYTGPRWTYGCQYRPVWVGSVPSGWIVGSLRESPDFRYGTVDYPRALTDKEIHSYELTEVQHVK